MDTLPLIAWIDTEVERTRRLERYRTEPIRRGAFQIGCVARELGFVLVDEGDTVALRRGRRIVWRLDFDASGLLVGVEEQLPGCPFRMERPNGWSEDVLREWLTPPPRKPRPPRSKQASAGGAPAPPAPHPLFAALGPHDVLPVERFAAHVVVADRPHACGAPWDGGRCYRCVPPRLDATSDAARGVVSWRCPICGIGMSGPAEQGVPPDRLCAACVHYAERDGRPWLILSARHGVIHPDRWTEPYDWTLATLADERSGLAVWRDRISGGLGLQLRHLGYPDDDSPVEIEAHMGAAYAEHLRAAVEDWGCVAIEEPLRGLQIGERLGWYAARRAAP